MHPLTCHHCENRIGHAGEKEDVLAAGASDLSTEDLEGKAVYPAAPEPLDKGSPTGQVLPVQQCAGKPMRIQGVVHSTLPMALV